jgi:poly(3-hydroxybutyrate) depolymerase
MTPTSPNGAPTADGVRLDLQPDGRTVTGAAAANAALAAFGTRLWPIDLAAAPDDVRSLLRRPELTAAESALVAVLHGSAGRVGRC